MSAAMERVASKAQHPADRQQRGSSPCRGLRVDHTGCPCLRWKNAFMKISTTTPVGNRVKTPGPRTKRSAARTAQATADRVSAMAADERRKMIAEVQAEYAPTLESAGCDLLATLNAVAAEFIRRYYPAATSASIFISQDASRGKAMMPIAVPKPE